VTLDPQGCSGEILHCEWPVHYWRRWLVCTVVADVLDDSDDFTPLGPGGLFANPLAQRGRRRAPKFRGKIFRNHGNRAEAVDIDPVQIASSDQASSCSRQQSGRYKLKGSDRRV